MAISRSRRRFGPRNGPRSGPAGANGFVGRLFLFMIGMVVGGGVLIGSFVLVDGPQAANGQFYSPASEAGLSNLHSQAAALDSLFRRM